MKSYKFFDTNSKFAGSDTFPDIPCKKTEKTPELSNNYNRSLIEFSLDPLIIMGPDGKIMDLNNATEQVTGYSKSDLIGTCFWNYFTEPEKVHKCHHQTCIYGKVWNHYLEIKHKDGHITPVLYNASVYKNETGEIMYIFAAARDITERKTAEEALKKAYESLEKLVEERTIQLERAYKSLKESEKGLAEAQKMAHIGNWDWNLATNELYYSDELYRIFGLNPQELNIPFNEVLNYIHPEDHEYVINAVKEAFNGKQHAAVDFRIITAERKERVIRAQGEVVFDEKNSPIRIIGTAQDITERKRAEEKLRESEEKYRIIVETANEGIIIVDDKFKVTFANRKVTEMFGYSVEKGIGKSLWDYMGDKTRAVVEKNMEKWAYGIIETYEIELTRKDGSTLWALVNSKPHFDESGRIIGVLAMLTDINERKKAEEKLRESEEKYRNIVETANEGIIIIDEKAIITYVNNRMKEMFRYDTGEGVGRSLWNFMNGKARSLVEKNIENLASGIIEPCEVELTCKDGSSLWALVNSKPLFDKNGRSIGVTSMLTDITKRKQEEQRVNRYNRVLEGINWIFSNVVHAKTEEELGNACLSVALEVTGSQFGFINEIGADGLLYDTAKSELRWEQGLICDKTGHCDFQSSFIIHGLFDSIINDEKGFFTNDLMSHPYNIDLPYGHPPITSFLGVPLFQDGKTVGLIAVANREGGYSYEQVEDLETIAPAVILALQRKRAEEALRLSNNYNRSLIEASLDPLVTIGPDGKITDVNGATEQVTGYSRNELIGTDFSDYFTEPEKARSGYQQVFTDGKVWDYSLEIQHKDGHVTPVLYNASVYKNEHGEIIGMFAAARDITERKKAEEKIKNLAKIVESSNDAIITGSLDGIIASWNKGAEQLYGYLAEEVLGKNISMLEPDELKGEIKRLRDDVKQGNKMQRYETSRLKKDGTTINVSVTLSPIFDQSEKLVAFSFIAEDITEKKIAEKLLQEKQMAEVANRTKNDFLANISHELRTPLNSIIGFSDMLYEQAYGELNKKQLRSVGNISKSGKLLLNLINNILDISKIEAGRMELFYKDFELVIKLNMIRNILFPIANKKNIRIEIDIDSTLSDICADEDKFAQIMYNLVDNAIKFSYEGSSVQIAARKKGDMVEITVKDTGTGIKVDDQYKLFKPFSQIHSFSSKKSQGTGLGLSLVKQIVHLHGGYIWFRSEYGKGSIFAFAIPINGKNPPTHNRKQRALNFGESCN